MEKLRDYWQWGDAKQWLNEREVSWHRNSAILTRHQIGLDYQSHYAHENMITEVAVPSPDPPQLMDWHITISFEWSHIQAVETGIRDKVPQMRFDDFTHFEDLETYSLEKYP